MDKLIIRSFEKNDFKEEDTKLAFYVPVNPETFSKNLKIQLEKKRGHGNSGTDPRYISTEPEELKLEFILDGTGTIQGYLDTYINMPVTQQLQAFVNCAYKVDGEIHRPRFLIVHWGSDLTFHCVLQSLDINYTLFKDNGDPLRVKVTAGFVNYKKPVERTLEQGNKSPDLTHSFLVKQGDRLDLMTFKVYDDPKYLLQVAKVNKLSTLRSIRPGITLNFPPFNKNES
jgi:hypothetical protein